MSFDNFQSYINDDKTRSFFGLNVGTGYENVILIIYIYYIKFKQIIYYIYTIYLVIQYNEDYRWYSDIFSPKTFLYCKYLLFNFLLIYLVSF